MTKFEHIKDRFVSQYDNEIQEYLDKISNAEWEIIHCTSHESKGRTTYQFILKRKIL